MSDRIKIGFDANVLRGRFQGSRTVLSQFAIAIALHAPDVDVCLYGPSEIADERAPQNLKALPTRSVSRLWQLGIDLPRRAVRDGLRAMIYQYIFAPWSKNSFVVIHDILPITHPHLFGAFFRLRSQILFAIAIRTAKKVIAVSQYTAAEIAKRFPRAEGRIITVPNGPSFPEISYFDPDKPALLPEWGIDGWKFVLSVGRIEKRKNIGLLLSAFDSARIDTVKLVIVGSDEGSGLGDLENRENVVHLTKVSDDALVSLYKNASLFVYPSQAEGFGLPLLDAVLFGVPTISSNKTAMPEVGGEHPEYFDPEHAHAEAWLTARIEAHFGGRPVRTPNISARKAHAKRFSWAGSARVFIDHIRCLERMQPS